MLGHSSQHNTHYDAKIYIHIRKMAPWHNHWNTKGTPATISWQYISNTRQTDIWIRTVTLQRVKFIFVYSSYIFYLNLNIRWYWGLFLVKHIKFGFVVVTIHFQIPHTICVNKYCTYTIIDKYKIHPILIHVITAGGVMF